MLNKEQVALTMEIVNRAEKLGLMQSDKLTALIDLEKATEHFNLRLADMLNADDFNFAHDFVQIQNDGRVQRKVFAAFCREGIMVSDKRYAPIAAELEGVAKRLGMEVWEVEELIYRKVEERYHLEDIKTWYEDTYEKDCSDKLAMAILNEYEDGEDANVDFWTNLENAYKRVKEKRKNGRKQ